MTTNPSGPDALISSAQRPASETAITISCSRGLAQWLLANSLSIAFTSYQSGRLYLVGVDGDGALSVHERAFERSMALCTSGRSLWLATAYQLWRFENCGQVGAGLPDTCYAPREARITGDVDIHDIGVLNDGSLVFVNTAFSCLSGISDQYNFRTLWKPEFISALVPEDRCHLNGMAVYDGHVTHVSALCRSDAAHGWRDRRATGGLLIDVRENRITIEGLCMPHSPRWHDGRLWLLNSGKGEFGTIDPVSGTFEAVAFLPGFLRGLAFIGNYAMVGLSKPRDGSFSGLPLDDMLTARDADPRCGIYVVDIRSGAILEWFEFNSGVNELFAVEALPGVRQPVAYGLIGSEIRTEIVFE